MEYEEKRKLLTEIDLHRDCLLRLELAIGDVDTFADGKSIKQILEELETRISRIEAKQ
jgi:hypothetical protein